MDTPELVEDDANTVRLRFVGTNEDGSDLHELRAAHVAEVLQGVVGFSSDMTKAGVFGRDSLDTEVLVRPAREGSFVIEVFQAAHDTLGTAGSIATAVGGVPLGQLIWLATKSARADVKDFHYLDNGNVKIQWQDDTAEEIPADAWAELEKNKRRRKKQLRQIMAPLSDERVESVEVTSDDGDPANPLDDDPTSPTATYTLTRSDYNAMRPEDEITETATIFETEALMSAIDFEAADKWRVKTKEANRLATMEDADFLHRVDNGLAIRKSDIFTLKIRQDAVEKNGRTTRKWTILEVKRHKRSEGDVDNA